MRKWLAPVRSGWPMRRARVESCCSEWQEIADTLFLSTVIVLLKGQKPIFLPFIEERVLV